MIDVYAWTRKLETISGESGARADSRECLRRSRQRQWSKREGESERKEGERRESHEGARFDLSSRKNMVDSLLVAREGIPGVSGDRQREQGAKAAARKAQNRGNVQARRGEGSALHARRH